ncbi:MAG: hypothetical protein JXR34_08950 [Bacteroidales bacterium]|nr:hypothetical protein [Bacteroidales bacterium]
MNKMTKTILITIIALALNNCEKNAMDKSDSIEINNNSSYSIGCYFGLGGKNGTLYPDTTLPYSDNYIIKEIKPNSKFVYEVGLEWDEIFANIPKDTMCLFFFDTDTLNTYGWSTLRNEYKILKRMDLSLLDIKQLNRTINYP